MLWVGKLSHVSKTRAHCSGCDTSLGKMERGGVGREWIWGYFVLGLQQPGFVSQSENMSVFAVRGPGGVWGCEQGRGSRVAWVGYPALVWEHPRQSGNALPPLPNYICIDHIWLHDTWNRCHCLTLLSKLHILVYYNSGTKPIDVN